jgi:mannose-6-phosphate isomerase
MAWTEDEVTGLIGGEKEVGSLLRIKAREFFRFDRIKLGSDYTQNACFAVVVVLEGAAELVLSDGPALSVNRGSTILIPFAAGEIRVHGRGESMFIRPPAV